MVLLKSVKILHKKTYHNLCKKRWHSRITALPYWPSWWHAFLLMSWLLTLVVAQVYAHLLGFEERSNLNTNISGDLVLQPIFYLFFFNENLKIFFPHKLAFKERPEIRPTKTVIRTFPENTEITRWVMGKGRIYDYLSSHWKWRAFSPLHY